MGSGVIYGLIDPLSDMLRYVGQSFALGARKRFHCNKRATGNTHCDAWKRSLWDRGLRPDLIEIERHTGIASLNEAEVFWIDYFRCIGCSLTNHQSGGSNHKVDETTRRKLSEKARGRSPSKETRRKLSFLR